MKKKRKIKGNFASDLADKLRALGTGSVDAGVLSDKSGAWVNLRIGDTELCFSFDGQGNTIDGVGLYKDKVEVVDQEKIWGNY